MQPRRARLETRSSEMSRNGRAGGYGVCELRVRAFQGSDSNVGKIGTSDWMKGTTAKAA
jgi:hypothetical protein